ncbi:hypothetical protein ACS0TY_009401 [Phlomoides rotata]
MFEGEDAFVRDQHTSTDLISMLPDELLVYVLSLLTLKESTATSILSRRWRYLWTLMPKLDFDAKIFPFKFKAAEYFKKKAFHEELSTKYVRWVDHVIALHKGCAIEDFRVYLYLTKPYEKYIDNWVNYALARKVKRLELDLADALLPRTDFSVDRYTFPYKFLLQYKENCSNNSQLHNTIYFKYLEKISLNYVNVNDEALEFFLSNCPLLQHLSVSRSKELKTLKIVGPYPCLKHLEIMLCSNLRSFEIRDASLVCLKYGGKSVKQFLLENVPLLVEIYIVGLVDMGDVLLMFSSILPQIEKFYFKHHAALLWKVTEMFYSSVKMSNLKHLVLMPVYTCSLLPIANILRASPRLQTFVLEICGERMITEGELKKTEGSYIHLKEVEIRGYCGSIGELEFVMHLLESAGALEKIVIDPREATVCDDFDYFLKNYTPLKKKIIRKESDARYRAKEQLLHILPPGINLQIL